MKLNKVMTLAKQHLPEILTATSVLGVITSDALFVYAAKKETEDGDKKHYILPIIASGVTIGCIIASNRVSNSQKASLAAGVALMADNYYKQRKAIKEVCTPEQQAEIDELLVMAHEEYSNDMSFTEDKQLYYLPQFNIIFWSTPSDVTTAQLNINEEFGINGEASLATFFSFLGILDLANQAIADHLGWRLNYMDVDNGIQRILFHNYEKKLKNGVVCHYIEFIDPPMTEADWIEEYHDEEYL